MMLLKIITFVFILVNPWLFLASQSNLNNGTKTTDLAVLSTASLAALNEPADKTEEIPDQTVHQLPLPDSYVQASVNPDYLPIRNWAVEEPDIDAKAAIIFDTHRNKVLWKKNIDEVLPIASITKLMTAAIVIENMKLERVVNVSQTAYEAPGNMGGLIANEKITVKTLLYAMLMESSNDAAVALAEAVGQEKFLKLMNQKAQGLDMTSTVFVDPSGFSPANVSSINDLIKLVRYTLNHRLIWQITSTPVIYLRSADGQYDHRFLNNNHLLSRLENVVGGKTGYTEQAKGCMVLVTTKPSQENLITIVLGSADRLLATEKLVNWITQGYIW